MPRIVELRGDPDLLARHSRSAHALAHLGLVAVGKGRVDVPVAGIQRGLDSDARLVLGRLPGTQADGGYLVSRWEGISLAIEATVSAQTAQETSPQRRLPT